MAMNKKEKAELDDLRKRLAEAKALRYLGCLAPSRVRACYDEYINGWDFNAYTSEVFEAWSQAHVHGRGHLKKGERDYGMPAQQNGAALYLTKRDATIGLRLAKESEFASALAKIDLEIENQSNH